MIIAGAGLSAALPGVVAAHTALPVIGVPLTSSKSVAGGLDALLDRADAAGRAGRVGVDNARNAAVLAARIPKRDRPLHAPGARRDLDRRGTDDRLARRRGGGGGGARGAGGGGPGGDPGATFTVEAVKEREAVTDHDAAFVDVLAGSAGPAGRWIHFGLTSPDVLDTAPRSSSGAPAR